METKISSYEQQAINFLKETCAKIETKFLRNDKYFNDDKDTRDIYEITITNKGGRKYIFNFGQSINNSCVFKVKNYPKYINTGWATQKEALSVLGYGEQNNIYRNPNFSNPTAYDVLCCVQKYDVGTFENFCGDFGYDTDSRTAEKTYKAVLEEYQNIQRLFTDAEIEKMQEIQ